MYMYYPQLSFKLNTVGFGPPLWNIVCNRHLTYFSVHFSAGVQAVFGLFRPFRKSMLSQSHSARRVVQVGPMFSPGRQFSGIEINVFIC